jgi:hypothetical protein
LRFQPFFFQPAIHCVQQPIRYLLSLTIRISVSSFFTA